MADFKAPTPEQIEQANTDIRYVAYTVFQAVGEIGAADRAALVAEVRNGLDALAERGLVVRGTYDVSVTRADADLMIWWHAPSVELLQEANSILRKSDLGAVLEPVWSVVGMHRPAEFNKSHVPAFLTDPEPNPYLCVYPFVRSYDWYLLDPAERSTMLRDHGIAAAGYKDIKANTIASFGLGDYEWLLAFEAESLDRIVDLMRDLRATEARRHVREEIPFFTGPLKPLEDIVTGWR
ncbi:chlorite dismutase family protein [Brevibacterium sp. 50QC2O2]|uniref:hydrogen peroxide-dependent heme synthase n=1 Tax=Brevibacterium sp. 50QC2O2 TaxID=2968459 RepID=UPI00211C4023|nr:hydrogen peroxide-dependent heme synthase [Brevibacterium sp. 50QC2O2]MCQ9388399.1 chlorite dismutase family protein [Brevibacterium sp. 50QC2O2]